MKKLIDVVSKKEITVCDFCGKEVLPQSGIGFGVYMFHINCHDYAFYPEEAEELIKSLPIMIKKFKSTNAYKEIKNRNMQEGWETYMDDVTQNVL